MKNKKAVHTDLLEKYLAEESIIQWESYGEAFSYLRLNDPNFQGSGNGKALQEFLEEYGFEHNGKYYTIAREEAKDVVEIIQDGNKTETLTDIEINFLAQVLITHMNNLSATHRMVSSFDTQDAISEEYKYTKKLHRKLCDMMED